jgi:hypothetical protein
MKRRRVKEWRENQKETASKTAHGFNMSWPSKPMPPRLRGRTVEAVATYYPAGLYLVAIAVGFDVRHDVVVRIDGQSDQAGGSIYLATVLMEIAGEDGLCGLLREADIEAVNAAATSQVYRPKELAVGMKF